MYGCSVFLPIPILGDMAMKSLTPEKSSTRRWAQRQTQDPFRVVLLRFPTQGVGWDRLVIETGRCMCVCNS